MQPILSNVCGESPVSNVLSLTSATVPDLPTISASGPQRFCQGRVRRADGWKHLLRLHRALVQRRNWTEHYGYFGRYLYSYLK
jgi:hypothetical protein